MKHDTWPLVASVILAGVLLWVADSSKPTYAVDPSAIATTTLTISICGDTLVDSNEECDVPGATGGYSTSIAGRQCTELCLFDSYCGDGVLQTIHGETCDDGNNTSGDFCSDVCIIEPISGGGGNTSGSSGGGGGGKPSEDYGDTSVSVSGKAYPNATVNILEDGDTIGTVRANAQGDFQFSNGAQPGATTYGFWANDSSGTRSTTFNTTFDVTQGAVTTLAGIYLAPTLKLSATSIEGSGTLVLSGQTIPNARVNVHIDNTKIIENVTADASGRWTLSLLGSRAGQGSHTVKVKFELATQVSGTVRRESTFSALQSFGVGTGAQPVVGSADLSRDGKINLIDFSILIFWWGTSGGNSNPPADINQNAKVGLEDFSILLFNWTG
jgi:cysteine-rich repeat protein